jgi:hypothetical protein
MTDTTARTSSMVTVADLRIAADILATYEAGPGADGPERVAAAMRVAAALFAKAHRRDAKKAGRAAARPAAPAATPAAEADAEAPVEWAGRTMGELTPDEQRRVIDSAAASLQKELGDPILAAAILADVPPAVTGVDVDGVRVAVTERVDLTAETADAPAEPATEGPAVPTGPSLYETDGEPVTDAYSFQNLRAIAGRVGIPGRSGMSKAALIEALNARVAAGE